MARIWNLTTTPIELEQEGVVAARWPVAGRVRVSTEERPNGDVVVGTLHIPVVARQDGLCQLIGLCEDEVLPGDVILAADDTVEMLRRHFGGRTRVLRVQGRRVGDALRVEKLLA